MVERQLDGGLLQRPVGLHNEPVSQGDVLLVVHAFDVGDDATVHLEAELLVAFGRKIEEPLSRGIPLAAAQPIPVGAGGRLHVVETAPLDRRFGERDVERGLGPRGTGAVDLAVAGERDIEPTPPFPCVGCLLREVVGGEVAKACAEATKGTDASGHELL